VFVGGGGVVPGAEEGGQSGLEVRRHGLLVGEGVVVAGGTHC
jgi:hypothetical protein